MRVLIIGSDNEWRMERGTQRALSRAGHTTKLIDDRRAKRLIGSKLAQRWSLSQARRFKPDFVVSLEVSRAQRRNGCGHHRRQAERDVVPRCAVVQEHLPARHCPRHQDRQAQHRHSSSPDSSASGRRSASPPSSFLRAPMRTSAPSRRQKAFRVRRRVHRHRLRSARANFLLKVAKKYDLKVWGRGWEEWRKPLNWSGRPVEGKEFAAVCSSSKIVLGVNPARYAADSGNTTSDRTWMVILAGGFFLGHGTPELKRMLREGDHCAWYKDIDSCLAQCAYYLENGAQRERIRREGQVFVRENHTFDQRIHNLLSGEEFHNPLIVKR